MAHKLDLTGQRFTRLVALRRVEKSRWLCQCDCGAQVYRYTGNLLKGKGNKSCGCLPRVVRHGHAKVGELTPTYRTWIAMKQRCANKQLKNYGARGITVCERWKAYGNFLADMGEKPSEWHSLDRIDTDANYEPSNCRWATRVDQCTNKRGRYRSLLITIGETTQSASQWAQASGMHVTTLLHRLKAGWPPDKAIVPGSSNRHRKGARLVEWRGETLSVTDWSKRLGMPYGTLVFRIKSGWSAEKAFTTPVYGKTHVQSDGDIRRAREADLSMKMNGMLGMLA